MDTTRGGHCSASNGALLVCWPRLLLERHGMLTFRKPLLLDESRGAMLQVSTIYSQVDLKMSRYSNFSRCSVSDLVFYRF